MAETLLEVVLNKYADVKPSLCNRIVFVAHVHPQAQPQECLDYLQHYMDTQAKKPEHKSPITGMMQIINRAVIATIESSNKNIMTLIKDMQIKLQQFTIYKHKQEMKDKETKEKEANAPLRTTLPFHKPGAASNSNPATSNPAAAAAAASSSSTSSSSTASASSTTSTDHNHNIATAAPVIPPTPCFTNIRIVISHEEVAREYKYFTTRMTNMNKTEHEDFRKSEVATLIVDCVRNIMDVAKMINTAEDYHAAQSLFTTGTNANSQSSQTKPINIIHKLPPSAEYILYLTTLEALFSLEEFIQIFDTPVQFLLESERVWPVEPLLKF